MALSSKQKIIWDQREGGEQPTVFGHVVGHHAERLAPRLDFAAPWIQQHVAQRAGTRIPPRASVTAQSPVRQDGLGHAGTIVEAPADPQADERDAARRHSRRLFLAGSGAGIFGS